MKTRAAVVSEKSGKFEIFEVDLAELRDDELLVRVVGVGICHTDLVCRDQLYPVHFPAVFGHEGSGVVEKVGARVTKLRSGDHVVMSYRACGRCAACRNGDPTHCANIFGSNFGGARADGSATVHRQGIPIFGNFFNQSSFAAYALANEANTVKVPKDVPLELLGPLGCGIQTGAAAVGCTSIIAIDLHQERLDLARDLGATLALDPRECNVVEEIQKSWAESIFPWSAPASPPCFARRWTALPSPASAVWSARLPWAPRSPWT